MGGGKASKKLMSIVAEPIGGIFPTLDQFFELEDSEQQHFLDIIRRNSMSYMGYVKNKLPWYYVDHGPKHVERVLENLHIFLDIVNKTSLIKEILGRDLSDKDCLMLKVAVFYHDTGIAIGGRKRHGLYSGNIVRKELGWEEVARLCELHSRSDTREIFGTDDLNELYEKGLINRREYALGSILRIVDALDIGAKRVAMNTQGQSFHEVIKMVIKSGSIGAKQSLVHWYGHKGIKRAFVKPQFGFVDFVFILDSRILIRYGEHVAYMIKYFLEEVDKTAFKNKYYVTVMCEGDKGVLKEWYSKYKWSIIGCSKSIKIKVV